MKRAIRFSVHSGRISRDERLHCFSFSVRKLPLGCFATSLLAMTIQLDRRPLSAGANGGGIKAPSKPFPSFSKTRVFHSKLFQTKLWRFCKISRGYKVSKRPLMLSKFFASSRPLLAAFCLTLRCSSVDGAFIHRGAATQIERILNLTDNPVFGTKYPYSPEPSLAGSAPASGRSPWMKRAFRFSVHSAACEGRTGFITSLFLREIYLAKSI